MVGLIQCTRENGRIAATVERTLGMDLLLVTFPVEEGMRPTALSRCLKRVEKLFRRAAVSRVVFPTDFPYRNELRQVKEVELHGFYRAVADVLVVGWLEFYQIAKKDRRVALAGPRVCPELECAARNLCHHVRELRIEVPGADGAALAAKLQRECGIPITPAGTPVDLTVEFGPTKNIGQIRLWGDRPTLDGFELRVEGVELPDEVSQPMLALLWERGRLRKEQFQVVKNKFAKNEKMC